MFIDEIKGFFAKLLEPIIKFATNFGAVWSLVCTFIVTLIWMPFNWGMGIVAQLMGVISTLTGTIEQILIRLQLTQLSQHWATVSYYVGIADNFVPIALCLYIATGLFALWVLTAKIRLVLWAIRSVKSMIPFLGS